MCKTLILMATYNGEKYIDAQLESIAKQNQKPNYILIRDDGSTDKTYEKIAKFTQQNADIKIDLVKNKTNLGWRENFQKLMRDASNYDVDYVFFSDQDDFWHPEKIREQVEIMESNHRINLLSSNFEIKKISKNATIPRKYTGGIVDGKPLNEDFTLTNGKVRKVKWDDIRGHFVMNAFVMCARKDFIDNVVNKFYIGSPAVAHDKMLTALAGTTHSYFVYDKILVDWLRHDDNTSSGGTKFDSLSEIDDYYSRQQTYYDTLKKYTEFLLQKEKNDRK